MSAVKITGKMMKIAAVLLLLIMCATYSVRADQQFVLKVGDTMVIPCLLEIWSDQSVSCVISNPEVLMSDGSGRAVIALGEGTSDVYVHMTNPDSDIRYTFVVEPAGQREVPGEWNLPEATAADGDAVSGEETRVDDGEEVNDGNHVSGGAEANGGNHVSGEERDLTGEGTDAEGGGSPGGSTDSKKEANLSEEDRADSEPVLYMPEEDRADSESDLPIQEDEHAARKMTESVPFWEDRGSEGITFLVIGDELSEKVKQKEEFGNQNAEYRPFAYLNSDGEVVPLFVCACGREVRWKYVGRILYIEAASTYSGPYRVCACDSWRNIYYFSS